MVLRCLATLLAGLAVCVPAAGAQEPGPDYVASDNVEFVTHLKEVGDGVGATIVGDRMYVTSTTHLTIFDISVAAAPKRIGSFTMNVEWENEEVPTNGRILGISSDLLCVVPDPDGIASSGQYCLAIYDVSDPENVKLLSNVADGGGHTSACVLDCTYFFGSEGNVVDATDPANAKKLEVNWITDIADRYGIEVQCHHVREIEPGIVLGACNPDLVFSVRPEDGGSPAHPAVISFTTEKVEGGFHSARWPRKGRDVFVLLGGETVGKPTCDDATAAFQTWDGSAARAGIEPFSFPRDKMFSLIDEFRPTNGNYVDGRNPVNAIGCSVHWFMEHPTFNNGGLVAVAAYENGTRFLQVGPDGKLTEQGYFQPLAGSTSAPHWHPTDGKILYAVDYARGVDVLRYTGDTYVPAGNGDVVPTPGAKPGTGGQASGAPACASAAGFRSATAKPRGRSVTFGVDRREQRPFTVDIFQQSQGSQVVKERLIQRFANKTRGFNWNGTDRRRRKLSDGNYFVRFTMRLSNGLRDIRRATLTRRGGRFFKAPDFYQRVDCGIFRSLKLSSSVFGGGRRVPLGIAYELQVPVRSVKIQVKVGSKTVKTFTGKGVHGRTYRFSVPAAAVARGKVVRVLVTPDRGSGKAGSVTLVAKRI